MPAQSFVPVASHVPSRSQAGRSRPRRQADRGRRWRTPLSLEAPRPSSPRRSSRRYSGAVIVGIAQAIEALLLATLGFAHLRALCRAGPAGVLHPGDPGVVRCWPTSCSTRRARTASRPIARCSARSAACSPAGRWCIVVLAVGIFLFKAGDLVSRVWLVSWYRRRRRRCWWPSACRCARWCCSWTAAGPPASAAPSSSAAARMPKR